jgi:hypothetical protein
MDAARCAPVNECPLFSGKPNADAGSRHDPANGQRAKLQNQGPEANQSQGGAGQDGCCQDLGLKSPPLPAQAQDTMPRNVATTAAYMHIASTMSALVSLHNGTPSRSNGVISAALKSLVNVVRRDLEVRGDVARAALAAHRTIGGRYCARKAMDHAAKSRNGITERGELLAGGRLLNDAADATGHALPSSSVRDARHVDDPPGATVAGFGAELGAVGGVALGLDEAEELWGSTLPAWRFPAALEETRQTKLRAAMEPCQDSIRTEAKFDCP